MFDLHLSHDLGDLQLGLVENFHGLFYGYRGLVEGYHGLVDNNLGLVEKDHDLVDNYPDVVEERSGLVDNYPDLVDEHPGLVDNYPPLDVEGHHVLVEEHLIAEGSKKTAWVHERPHQPQRRFVPESRPCAG